MIGHELGIRGLLVRFGLTPQELTFRASQRDEAAIAAWRDKLTCDHLSVVRALTETGKVYPQVPDRSGQWYLRRPVPPAPAPPRPRQAAPRN
jgi:hypothetical protein